MKWVILPLCLVSQLWAQSTRPEIIEQPRDAFIVKNNAAILKCTAKNAGELKFRCNDNWFSGLSRVTEKKWFENGIQMIQESLEIRRSTVEQYLGPDDYFCNCVAWANDGDGSTVVSSSAKVKIAFLKQNFQVREFFSILFLGFDVNN